MLHISRPQALCIVSSNSSKPVCCILSVRFSNTHKHTHTHPDRPVPSVSLFLYSLCSWRFFLSPSSLHDTLPCYQRLSARDSWSTERITRSVTYNQLPNKAAAAGIFNFLSHPPFHSCRWIFAAVAVFVFTQCSPLISSVSFCSVLCCFSAGVIQLYIPCKQKRTSFVFLLSNFLPCESQFLFVFLFVCVCAAQPPHL